MNIYNYDTKYKERAPEETERGKSPVLNRKSKGKESTGIQTQYTHR